MGVYSGALEKDYLEHPRFACCTDDMFEIFIKFGRCLCCLLPLFVNRQLPCLPTNSHHALSLPPMHHRNPWCAKERAPGVKGGALGTGVSGRAWQEGQKALYSWFTATCMHPQAEPDSVHAEASAFGAQF